MKKILLSTILSAAVAISLNAAVVATVDGENITDEDIAALLSQAMPGANPSSLSADVKKRVINDIIGRKLLLKDAKASGIEKDPEFARVLGLAKDNIIGELYFKKIFDSIKVSDAEITNFYNEHKNEFNQPARSHARHILVEKESDAKDIINQLKKLKGDELTKKFSELAKTKSIDKGSAAQGGDLGWFESSAMVKPFADAVNSMKKNELSKTPVKSNFGYHVIIKEDSKPAGIIPLKDIKEQVEYSVKMQKFQEVIKTKTDNLRSKAKIEYK